MQTDHPQPKPTARRNNADYRWTVAKVGAFLDALAQCGTVAGAARAVGMSRQSAYRLRARLAHPRFQAAFEAARGAGVAALAEARTQQTRSQWGEPGLDGLDYLRASTPQGDGGAGQGDSGSAHGDGTGRQADAEAPKVTV